MFEVRAWMRGVAVAVLVMATATVGAVPAGSAARSGTARSASSAGPAALVVSPSTALVDGQQVTITRPSVPPSSGSGDITYVLCPAGSSDVSNCAYLDPVTTGPTSVVVSVPGRILSGDGLETVTATDCRVDDCVVRAVVFPAIAEAVSGPSEPVVPDVVIVAEASVQFDPGAPLRTPPSVEVSPSTDLADGQSVQVTVTAGTTVVDPTGPGTFVAQCASPITSIADLGNLYNRCDIAAPIELIPSNGGSYDGTINVSAFVETSDGPVDCRAPEARCSIVAVDPVGQTDYVPLDFDPNGTVKPRFLQRPIDFTTEDFHVVFDVVGLTPGDPFTVKWCNEAHECLSDVVAAGTLDARGVGTFTYTDDAFPTVADDDTTCTDLCVLTAMDAHGLVASSDFGIGIGPIPPTEPFSSARHPVTVTPHKGLHDGDTVTVTASGYRPGASVAIVECDGAALDEGANACDIDTSTVVRGQRLTADADGNVSATYEIQRHLNIGEKPVDCLDGNVDPDAYAAGVAVDPTRTSTLQGGGYFSCIIAVADLTNYSDSGGTPIAFEGARFKKLPWEHDAPASPGPRTASAATPVKAQPSFTG